MVEIYFAKMKFTVICFACVFAKEICGFSQIWFKKWIKVSNGGFSSPGQWEKVSADRRISCIADCQTRQSSKCGYDSVDRQCYFYVGAGASTLTNTQNIDFYISDYGEWTDLRHLGVESLLLIQSEVKSWTGAELYCNTLGAHLYSMSTPLKYQALKDTFQAKGLLPLQDHWVGTSDLDIEGEWVWFDGAPVLSNNWDTSQPNDYDGEQDCAELQTNTDFKLNDMRCNDAKMFLCEILL